MPSNIVEALTKIRLGMQSPPIDGNKLWIWLYTALGEIKDEFAAQQAADERRERALRTILTETNYTASKLPLNHDDLADLIDALLPAPAAEQEPPAQPARDCWDEEAKQITYAHGLIVGGEPYDATALAYTISAALRAAFERGKAEAKA